MSEGQRNIALVGFGGTLTLAPWTDPTWSIWVMNNAPVVFAGRYDVLFEMHTKAVRDKAYTAKDDWNDARIEAIAKEKVVYTLDGSLGTTKWPIDKIAAHFGRLYFTSSIAYMMATAIMTIETEPSLYARQIGVWGIELEETGEYAKERGCFEFWAGVAIGKGIIVTVPEQSPILKSTYLYGYAAARLDGITARVAARVESIDRAKQNALTLLEEAKQRVWQLEGMRAEEESVLVRETDARPTGKPLT